MIPKDRGKNTTAFNYEALEPIQEPAHVLLVLPYPRRQGKLTSSWVAVESRIQR